MLALSINSGLCFAENATISPPPSCDNLTAEAATFLNTTGGCGGSSPPSCNCQTSESGIYFGVCPDTQQICSTLDSSVCGTQGSAFHYLDGGEIGNEAKYYLFTYDNGVVVYFQKLLDTCEASITDAAGTETPCECNYKLCSDGISSRPYITCFDYESGAFADACMGDGWGVQGGVMLAFSIKSGLCARADGPTIPAATTAP
jgi:hypothetical protein